MVDHKKITKILQTTMLDPTRVAIWFEILRKPKITAKELMEIIPIKKTAMYYHLTLLEDEEIISSKVVKKQKYYQVQMNFFELFQASKEILKENQREMDIFTLLVMNSFNQRELNKLTSMSPKEYKNRKYPLPYSGLWFTTREKLEKVKEEYKKFYDKILELDKDQGPESIAYTPLAYYWGIMDFE
jgi:DNA-binding transcriptional ArsR family regulator